MKRRDFIRKSMTSAALTAAAFSLPGLSKIYSSPSFSSPLPYDMVAIKGGEPDVMFDKAIDALGGISAFVKKGQTVVVKPNIGWDVTPERAGNTNPLLVKRIIQQCLQAGAKQVYVFDNTCDKWDRCYAKSGIEQAVKDAGGKVVPGNTENYYQEVQIPNGKKLKAAKVHELILQSDVFINVPILKSHSSTRLTIAMKNLMGVVWDRGYWHRNDIQQCIADYISFKKPTLNVVDAYNVLIKNGPRGVSDADVSTMKSLLISTDIVAVDAAAAKIFGMRPEDVPHIQIADSMGLGTMNLDKLNIQRIIL